MPFFKAILFIAVGDLIHRRRSYQSFLKTGQLVFRSHIRATGSFVASLGLIGAPFIAAFYSKEPILETSILLGISTYSVISIVLRLALTSYYSIRLIIITTHNWPSASSNSFNGEGFWTSLAIMILIIPAFLRGSILPDLTDLEPTYYSLKYDFYDPLIQRLILIITCGVRILSDSFRLYTLYFINLTFPNLLKNHIKTVYKRYFHKSSSLGIGFITPLRIKVLKGELILLRSLIIFNDRGLTKKFLTRIRTFKFNESTAFQLEWNTLYHLMGTFLWLSLVWSVFV